MVKWVGLTLTCTKRIIPETTMLTPVLRVQGVGFPVPIQNKKINLKRMGKTQKAIHNSQRNTLPEPCSSFVQC